MAGHLLVQDIEADDPPVLPATLDPGFISGSKTILGAGHVENLLFYADDITMGALGPAMKRLGVPVPDVMESGLYDPEILPLAWFEKLADAGCDRFLVRGIPRSAFPVKGAPDSWQTGAGEMPSRENSVAPSFPAGSYAEARQRLWAVAGMEFPEPGSDLLWLDYSRGDRWAVAAGQKAGSGEAGTLESIDVRLGGMFFSVTQGVDTNPQGKPWTRMVISSHRPLPKMGDLAVDRASRGVCLAMGHPSLKTDLEAWLGSGWRVGALYDIAPEDLPGEGTKI